MEVLCTCQVGTEWEVTTLGPYSVVVKNRYNNVVEGRGERHMTEWTVQFRGMSSGSVESFGFKSGVTRRKLMEDKVKQVLVFRVVQDTPGCPR